MDRYEQQLGHNIVSSKAIAFKEDGQPGYSTEISKNKDECICLTLQDEDFTYGSVQECKGICTKQNINIYIENYKTRTNNRLDYNYNPLKSQTYPYYKSFKSENQVNLPNSPYKDHMFSDVAWKKAANKVDQNRQWSAVQNNCLNFSYYPYINNSQQYSSKETCFTKRCEENKSTGNHVQVNISTDSHFFNEKNNNYMCIRTVDNGKGLVNQAPEQKSPFIVSRTMSPPSCKNLYVAPPYFTVDKFVSQTHPKTKREMQQCGEFDQHIYENQKLPLNIDISYNKSDNKLVQTKPSLMQSNYKDKIIGVNLTDNSINSISLDGSKHTHNAYIKREYSSYEHFFPTEDSPYPLEGDIHIKVHNIDSPNKIRSPVQSCTNTNSYQITNSIGRNSKQYAGSINEIDSHYVCNEKLLTPTTKNVSRETKKPNYRELINHVHAIRSAISEDDLNMQIIKRTLNYNQDLKEVPRRIPAEIIDTVCLQKQNDLNACIFENSAHIAGRKDHNSSLNICAPLDLSVKTIRTKADSTENNLNHQTFVQERGYPPKLNFKPNFHKSEFPLNFETKATKTDKRTLNTLSESKWENNIFSGDMNMPNNFSKCYKQVDTNVRATNATIDYRLENEFKVESSMPSVRGNIVYSLQNCIKPQICAGQEHKQGRGIKLEVTLKRTIPFNKEIEIPHKKICFGNMCGSEFDKTLTKTCSFKSKTELKTTSNDVIRSSSDNFTENINKPLDALNNDRITHLPYRKMEMNNIKNETITEFTNGSIEQKQDKTSCAASSRIRTKAELKGFTFHDNDFLIPYLEKEKENCLNNYGIHVSLQIDELDLDKWGDACNDFANQLANNYKTTQVRNGSDVYKIDDLSKKEPNSDVFKTKISGGSDSQSNNDGLLEASRKEKLDENENDGKIDIEMDTISKNSTQKQKTDYEIDKLECTRTKIGSTSMARNNNIQKNKYRNELCKGLKISIRSGKLCNPDSMKYNTRNKYKDKNSIKTPRVSDLTKISVVRLKREKYSSKRYFHCEKNIKDKAKRFECNNLQTYKTIINSPNCLSHSRSRFKKDISKNPSNPNTIDNIDDTKNGTVSTRSRKQRLDLNVRQRDPKLCCKLISSKDNELHSTQKQTYDEMKEKSDKMYLEVYKYKRALKIPPNLITINNSTAQRMSSSLPDLDADFQKDILENEINANIGDDKKEETPKSIIDVLHSRVVKSKCRSKRSQKHTKDEYPIPTRLVSDCSNVASDSDCSNNSKNNNANLKYRNVFETQILSSRTRMEYKMQLNKETIREIFHGNERSASAPPEINNTNNSVQNDYEKYDQQFCFKDEYIIEKMIGTDQDSEKKNQNKLERSTGKTNDNQSIELRTYTGKKVGRTYRRKFSSGFDYLRKKKKSNTHVIFNQTNFKRKDAEFITNFKIKSEKDVLKEVQKWVLNKSVGQSALHKAARLGYIDVIVYCLEKMSLNPNHKDNAGYTPLHDACVNGNLEIVKILLQYGANHSEGAHSGIRPLHEASENGHIEIIRMLLSYGADPLLETYSGQSPLKLASDIEVNNFFLMHLRDIQLDILGKVPWKLPGPWKLFDDSENGFDIFDVEYQNNNSKNDVQDADIFLDKSESNSELFEFEEANMPLPPLYLLKDEGMEKWVLLNDLCSLLKVKSKDTLLHKIFPSMSSATISRVFLRELKMCEFLEKATCLQLLCAGEKVNICHSKVVLIQYNENVRKLLGVNTIFMKF